MCLFGVLEKEKDMSGTKRKLVTLFSALTEEQIDRINAVAGKNGFTAVYCGSRDEAKKEISDAEVYLGMDADLISFGNDLKWVCSTSAGVGHFMGVLEGKDIVLTNSSGAYGVTIAEHIIMVTLELMRRRMEYFDIVRDRKWVNSLPIHSIRNSRITLLGTGNIGQETAARLRAFAPKTIVGVNRRGSNPDGLFDRIISLSEMESILPQTDLLISSLPSTGQTKDLLTADRLKMLPSDAYLVNVGRGDTIDQEALEQMLREGLLGGAALDVFREEPIPADSTLWECPGLIITPHSSGTWTLPYTVETIVDMFVKDFDNYCAGRKLERIVDRKEGY